MSDVFREIEEDLRRERLKHLATRFGPYVAGVAILAIAVVGGYAYFQSWQQDRREEAGNIFVAALNEARAGDVAKALETLDGEANADDGGYGILAAFAAAGIRSGNGEEQAAIAGWRLLAADSAVGRPLRDAATLLAAMHAMNRDEAPADLEAELAPLAGSGRPLSYLARELTALLALSQGDEVRAKEILTALVEDPQIPAGLRGRVSQLLDSLGS
ncbi:MAG: tetratricopeptide repeat protein [Rhodospirillales bacterium]|nr:tetratricopeptide repeat protein [Rhodospirillales bacterium]